MIWYCSSGFRECSRFRVARQTSYHQRAGNTSMADRSLVVLVAALLLVLAIVVFFVALGDYLFQPMLVQ
jgi:hypothetical protein